MKEYLPNAKHVFMQEDSSLRATRLFVQSNPSPVPVAMLLDEMAAGDLGLAGPLPYGLSPDAIRECLRVASQAVDRACDAETVTAVLHDAKNLVRDACGHLEEAKLEPGIAQNRRLRERMDHSARSLADLSDLLRDLLHRWRDRRNLSLPAEPSA